MTLNRNPANFFAEVEQVAYHVGHLVRGIEVVDDPLMQARLFSKVQSELIAIVEALGKERGFDMIIDLGKSGAIYWTPATDLTAEVIKRYDASKRHRPAVTLGLETWSLNCSRSEMSRNSGPPLPLLLADRAGDGAGKSIAALKNVTVNEAFLGAFSAIKIMPGVLIVEAIAQAKIFFPFHSGPGKGLSLQD
jgi:hypothetical protein